MKEKQRYLMIGRYCWHVGSCYRNVGIPTLHTGILRAEANEKNFCNEDYTMQYLSPALHKGIFRAETNEKTRDASDTGTDFAGYRY
jgi:hypothetical protein